MKSCPKIPDFPEKNSQDQDVPTLRRSRYFFAFQNLDGLVTHFYLDNVELLTF